MTMYVDGVRTDQDIDDYVSTSQIEAMEIYTSLAEVPVQYRTGPCGVGLIWTRGSGARINGDGGGGTWKGALAIFGVVGALWAVSR